MALFWENIKGFNKDTNNNTYYTWLHFAATNNNVSQSNSPTIVLTDGNTYDSTKSLGHILTDGISISIDKPWIFSNLASFNKDIALSRARFNYSFNMSANEGTMNIYGADNYVWYKDATMQNPYLQLTNNNITLYKPTIIDNTLKVQNEVEITSKCTAQYFNTTSDRRLKDNIKPVQDSMLDLINSINLYTFNYTLHPDIRSIGVIAQEVQDINVDGFKFVDNSEEFLSVKESKLVYLLLGAVKELSQEVKELKKKLGE